jgi:hypothetical protein
LIEAIRSELREEFLAALGGGHEVGNGRKAGRAKPGPKPKNVGSVPTLKEGGRRSSEAVEQIGKKVLAYVKANPGQRVEQIAVGLGTDTRTLKLPIIKLLQRPAQLTTKGNRRGTTYQVKG